MQVFHKIKLRASRQQERLIAAGRGGRVVAGSGNQPSSKGDVKERQWLGEAKITVSPRYSLTLSTWRTIESQAFASCREPYLVIEMAGRKLVVIRYETFEAALGEEVKDLI
jgi:hypothetical protein